MSAKSASRFWLLIPALAATSGWLGLRATAAAPSSAPVPIVLATTAPASIHVPAPTLSTTARAAPEARDNPATAAEVRDPTLEQMIARFAAAARPTR